MLLVSLVSVHIAVYHCQCHWCQDMYQSTAISITGVRTCTSLLLSVSLVSGHVPVYCYHWCQDMYPSTAISHWCRDMYQPTAISYWCQSMYQSTAIRTCTSLLLSVSLVSVHVPIYCYQYHWCQSMYLSTAITGVSTCTSLPLSVSLMKAWPRVWLCGV